MLTMLTTVRIFAARLRALVRGRQMERELDDEIASHLAEATDEYVRQGMSPEMAHWAARRNFGGVMRTKEAYRRQRRSFLWLDDLARDVRFGARMLVKDRWVALAAISALAIGIAANNTVFTVVNAIVLRDLPFDQPDRIVAIGMRANNMRTLNAGVSYQDFRDWRAAVKTFDDLGAMKETTMNVGDEQLAPERFIGSYISANAFGMVKQQPVLGRDFSADDDRPGAPPVVILGHSLWRNRYASDPGVLGRTIRVNGVPSVVIGVMPEDFRFPTRSRLWQPLALLPEKTLATRDGRDLSAFGRLAPGVRMEQAATELSGITSALAERHPETNRGITTIVLPYRDRAVGGKAKSTLPVLMGVVAVVLLMACANVANLLLARASARSHEVSVRRALGASRAQIVRQLLVESLLLASLAGVAGWGLSVAAVRALSNALSFGDVGLPYWIRFTLDERVLTFSIGLSLVTALLFGLVPALQTSKAGGASTLIEAGRAVVGTVRSRRWAHSLVVFQLALTPVLLTGGALMMHSIVAQYEMDAGVETARIVWARLDLPHVKYPTAEDRARFYLQLDDRLASVRGLTAGLVSHPPFGGGVERFLWRDDEAIDGEPRRPRVQMVTAGPRYLETFRRKIVRGVEPSLLDTGAGVGAGPSVVVNEWLAANVFPDQDAIGRRICLTPASAAERDCQWFTIAGISPNIRQSSTKDTSGRDGVVYVSYGANASPSAGIVARSESDASVVAGLLRDQVRAIDPDLPLYEVMPLDDLLAGTDERVGLRVFGGMFVAFAVVALLLATVGLYAVTAYTAAQRTREIGVRVALGAQQAQIWWLVTRTAAWQLGIGLSIGMLGAIGISGLLANALIGTRAINPPILLAVAALLTLVCLSACFLPARRAMRLDPAAVLRCE